MNGRLLAFEAMTPDNGALLAGAGRGDSGAWATLVDRFAGLVWSVARSYRLDPSSTDDVVQTVWLRLAEHCGRIREPGRLAGWLATTTRNEALRVHRVDHRITPTDDVDALESPSAAEIDEALLDSESLAEALRAFRCLDDETQQLLRLLCVDPPLDYQTISELTGRPVGSIGPTRARALEKLRRAMTEQAATTTGDDP